MRDGEEVPEVEELYRMVRQLEDTAREAHVHLRDELADAEERLDVQATELGDLREDIADAQAELRQAKQYVADLEARLKE